MEALLILKLKNDHRIFCPLPSSTPLHFQQGRRGCRAAPDVGGASHNQCRYCSHMLPPWCECAYEHRQGHSFLRWFFLVVRIQAPSSFQDRLCSLCSKKMGIRKKARHTHVSNIRLRPEGRNTRAEPGFGGPEGLGPLSGLRV